MLTHPEFKAGVVTTGFIDEHPELLQVTGKNWDFANVHQADQEKVMQVEKLLRYLANLAVNGHPKELGANPARLRTAPQPQVKPPRVLIPGKDDAPTAGRRPGGWRSLLLAEGPAAYAKAVRRHCCGQRPTVSFQLVDHRLIVWAPISEATTFTACSARMSAVGPLTAPTGSGLWGGGGLTKNIKKKYF